MFPAHRAGSGALLRALRVLAARRSSCRHGTPKRSGDAVAEIEAAGGEGLAVTGEATSEADAGSLCARAVERFGRIDTFVACVMVTVYAEVEELEPDELRRVMDVNFLGRTYAYRAALPHLKASRGTFIDVNSGLAYRGIPLQAAYCASKAAARDVLRVRPRRAREAPRGRRPLPDPAGRINTPQFDRAARSWASSRSRCRRSTSRKSSPRRSCTAPSGRNASCR